MNKPSAIKFPSTLHIQKKIAFLVSAVDDNNESKRAVIIRLEELADEIFKSWFIDFKPFAKGEFYDDEYGRRPKYWGYLNLGELTDRCKCKNREKCIIVQPKAFVYNPSRIVKGAIAINDCDYEGCVKSTYVVFHTIPCYENFVRLFFRSRAFKDEVILRTFGSNRKSLNFKAFSSIPIIVPPLQIIEKFNEVCDSISTQIKKLELGLGNGELPSGEEIYCWPYLKKYTQKGGMSLIGLRPKVSIRGPKAGFISFKRSMT